MIKRSKLQKTWRGTIRQMIFVNIFFAIIVAVNLFDRLRTASGPSIKETLLAALAWAGFNIVLYFLMRLTKEAIDAWGGTD